MFIFARQSGSRLRGQSTSGRGPLRRCKRVTANFGTVISINYGRYSGKASTPADTNRNRHCPPMEFPPTVADRAAGSAQATNCNECLVSRMASHRSEPCYSTDPGGAAIGRSPALRAFCRPTPRRIVGSGPGCTKAPNEREQQVVKVTFVGFYSAQN
ncbi:hypothetical protein RRG08_014786 [Elysia crispata]|uniref:Uncharacterized protein n=1 Tax=Elysia crispata TaxID=231223 RepID=A0AAE1AWP2_9GAST|nr:hypothetical protein RRG08_014786 [Elysia crispata]